MFCPNDVIFFHPFFDTAVSFERPKVARFFMAVQRLQMIIVMQSGQNIDHVSDANGQK